MTADVPSCGEVIRVGWLGIDGEPGLFSSLVGSLPWIAMMVARLALTMLMLQQWFRWEPRTQP